MLKGHCFCEAVRYETDGVPTCETNCHCTTCRRTSGAAFLTWFTVPTHTFRITAGTPARLKSSAHGERTFCSACGTPLTFQSDESAQEIDITTCSLENPQRLPPKDHTFTRSKLDWVSIEDGLPAFRTTRS